MRPDPAGETAGRSRGAVFGRRRAHALKPRQAQALDTLLPGLQVDLDRPPPADLRALFAVPVDRLMLEIGFGAGEHLAARLEADPRLGMIGAEPFLNGMAKLLASIDGTALVDRTRVHFADAVPLLDWLPASSLDRVYLLYPDPWPKARHAKRRFVNPDNLARIARVLKPGAEFRFASDWADYVNWTLAQLAKRPEFRWLATTAADWTTPWPGWTRTRYEAKALSEGRTPAYLRFERT